MTEQYRKLASELEQRLAAFAAMPLESPEVQPPETNEREHACMAKKHAPDRKPYSPVDAALMRSLPTIFGSTSRAQP